MSTVSVNGQRVWAGTLSREEAAAHCGIPVQTFCALQKVGVLPTSDITSERLDQVLAELFKQGLSWPTPTRKSRWRGFPYTQPIWKEVEGGLRLHARWRHPPDAKPIRHPFGSSAWLKEWFSCERRRHAALIDCERRYAAQQGVANETHQPAAGQQSQNPADSNPKVVTRIQRPSKTQQVPPSPAAPKNTPRTPAELVSRMRRRRAAVSQAEIARVIRAAKQAGAAQVEVRLNDSSSVIVRLQSDNPVDSEEIIL